MSEVHNNSKAIEPFLKWAGGKRWLVSEHRHLFPLRFRRYIEPFLGSGAAYFALQPRTALLADINNELIQVYQAVQKDWDKVQSLLRRHQSHHSHEYYYSMRRSNPPSPWGCAARFIYLNRTCWNGLYRVNQLGQFNVPIGNRKSVLLATDDFQSTSRLPPTEVQNSYLRTPTIPLLRLRNCLLAGSITYRQKKSEN